MISKVKKGDIFCCHHKPDVYEDTGVPEYEYLIVIGIDGEGNIAVCQRLYTSKENLPLKICKNGSCYRKISKKGNKVELICFFNPDAVYKYWGTWS